MANSAVSLGGRAGAVLAPALTPLLMGAAAVWVGEAGRWRPPFVVYGLLGLVWAVFFWRWFRDEPRQHGGCNDAEIALIEAGEQTESQGLAQGGLPLRAIVSSRNVWLMSLISFTINVGWIFLVTWLPTYLIEVHGVSEKRAGFYTSLTALAGMGGCLSGGVATDFLVRCAGLQWARRIPGIVAHGGAALSLAGCWMLDEVGPIVTLLIVASFLGDFALGAIWATYQDIGGPYAGTVLGFGNMCGNIGAACGISLIGRLQESYGWPTTFIMAGCAFTIAAFGWLGVDSRVKVRVDAPR